MNVEEINQLIEELKNTELTVSNCSRLASLYIIRENLMQDSVSRELSDILPQYQHYVELKRNYQLGQIGESSILIQMKKVCTEIEEFLNILYSNTDMPEERELLIKSIQKIISKIS